MDNNNPQVYTTGQGKISNKPWFKTWRIIYPILALVVLVELVWGAKQLLAPLPQPPKKETQKLVLTKGARIQLVSSKIEAKTGELIPVTVKISTGGYTIIGTDLVMRFDPSVLEASANSFVRGNIYNEFPQINIDSKNGVIRISGIAANITGGFNGGGNLGVINFKAKKTGTAKLIIDFKKGVTSDSNMIRAQASEDILASVSNLSLTIK